MTQLRIAAIDAEIAELEKARTEYLLGKSKVEVQHASGRVRFGGDIMGRLPLIEGRINTLKIERARLTGESLPLGPVKFGFGGRT